MSESRVLVTGGTGFVGANLTRRLVADGCETHLLVTPTHQTWRLKGVAAHVRLHLTDLGDADRVAALVREVRPQVAYHLAAYGAYSWQTDAARIARTNLDGTRHLVEACAAAGCEAFVNTGSSSEYGFRDRAPAEDEPAQPAGPYAVAKSAATQFCRGVAGPMGRRLCTLRLYSVYGPWEEPGRFIPALVMQGLARTLPPLVDPDVARDFVYVDDAVGAYLAAAAAEHQETGAIYNVGTGVQTTIREAVEAARREFSIGAEPRWGSMPNRVWDTTVWVANAAKIRRELGWTPRVGFAEGLWRTAAWFREHPEYHARYANPAAPGAGA